MKEKYDYSDLLEVIERLRAEDGCPWDREQTHETLRQCLIEETYEVIDAIDRKDDAALCEELGDVLLQVVFHAQLAKERKAFYMDEIADGICKKMISRHTHVFADETADTSDDVLVNWERIKKEEKGYKNNGDVLKSVPSCFPALIRAQKVQKKATEGGMDLGDIRQAFAKISENLARLETSVSEADGGGNGRSEEETGELLFSVVNLGRLLKINTEFALTKSIEQFINRFVSVEDTAVLCEKQGSEPNSSEALAHEE